MLLQIQKDILVTKNYFRKKSKVKLALIGSNIAHSKSQDMYEKILKQSINYDLIDVPKNELPTLIDLAAQYDGVSITAPYKKDYLDKISNKEEHSMINTLIFSNQNGPQLHKGQKTKC